MSTTMPTRPVPWTTTVRRLLHSAGAQAPRLRNALLMLAAAAAIQGLALACLLPLLQAVFDGRPVAAWLGAMLALMVVASVLRWRAQGFDYDGGMAQATHALRGRLGAQLRQVPLEYLQDRRTGEVNTLLLDSVDENLHYVLTIANVLLLSALTPLVVALATLWVAWPLGLMLLLVFPAIVPLYRWRRPAFGRGLRILAAAQARNAAEVLEYAQGLPVLRATGRAGERDARLQASFLELERIQVIGQRKGAVPNLVIASVVEGGLLLVAAAGAWWVARGAVAPAVFAAVLVVLARFSEPLSSFIGFTSVLELIEAALERVEALLAVAPLPQRPATEPRGFDIQFDAVDFAYAGATDNALRGFEARLPARSMTALVGPSGAGKSTLVRLILRHADPQAGTVRIGGADLRALAPERLAALVSVVFQDVHLFDDTVLNNIRMARPGASDAEVLAAAEAAQCCAFIARLPQGWDTRLGELGGGLSGGERQRLSIARALLKGAPIVLLDEPTAALDTGSERAVQRAIEALVRDRTVVVVAHRLSTIVGADQILLVEDGRLAAAGDHAALLAASPRYRAMWQAQQRVKDWHASAR